MSRKKKEQPRFDISAYSYADQIVTWRINDHRGGIVGTAEDINTTVEAPSDMTAEEVILKVTTIEELRKMKLVVAQEECGWGRRSFRPVIHVYYRAPFYR